MYHYSKFEIIGFLFLVILTVVGTIYKRKIFNSYRLALVLTALGFVAVSLSLLFNCISAARWDITFIVDSLLLKDVNGTGWLGRGYLFIIWGITVLCIATFPRLRDKGGRG